MTSYANHEYGWSMASSFTWSGSIWLFPMGSSKTLDLGCSWFSTTKELKETWSCHCEIMPYLTRGHDKRCICCHRFQMQRVNQRWRTYLRRWSRYIAYKYVLHLKWKCVNLRYIRYCLTKYWVFEYWKKYNWHKLTELVAPNKYLLLKDLHWFSKQKSNLKVNYSAKKAKNKK